MGSSLACITCHLNQSIIFGLLSAKRLYFFRWFVIHTQLLRLNVKRFSLIVKSVKIKLHKENISTNLLFSPISIEQPIRIKVYKGILQAAALSFEL